MNRFFTMALIASAALVAWSSSSAQVAGKTTVGIAVAQVDVVASGWSAKKQILGKLIYNEDNEQVGRIDDLIVAPDQAVSFVIVGAGGFVGLKRHQVAIPVEQLSVRGGDFVLLGATKAAIKRLPNFEYAN
jgi:PRC-barrel domain.